MATWVRCSLLVGVVGCASGQSDGPSSVALTGVEISVQSAGSTTIRRSEVSYEGDRIKDIIFAVNGAPDGRMEAAYGDGRLVHIDVVDADGDRGEITFAYDDHGRVATTQFIAPSVYTMSEDYDYDDGRDGVAREVMRRMMPVGGTPQTSYLRFEHDDELRLVEINEIVDTSSDVLELDYDEADRLERVTTYDGVELVEMHTYEYDPDGRLESITGLTNERWDVSYTEEGYIEEIRRLSPGSGETTVITYTYGTGHVDGIRFAPDLPNATLFDLRGQPFPTVDFLNLAPGNLGAEVPTPPNTGPVCGNGLCESGESSASCSSDCGSSAFCGNSVCESGETSSTCPSDCGSTGTCWGNCGGSSGSCYCDSSCTSNGDCCPDYQSACGSSVVCGNGVCESGETSSTCPSDCGSTSSCVGHCGGAADTCYCDSACTSNGDCCPDYGSVC